MICLFLSLQVNKKMLESSADSSDEIEEGNYM